MTSKNHADPRPSSGSGNVDAGEDRRPRTRRPADERAEDILEEARQLFSVRGYRGTTIAEVARGVGITDAGVLHHFPTKRDLLAAVLARSTEHQAELFRKLLDKGGIEAIRSLGDWGAVMESEPYHMGLEVALSAEALDGPSQLRDFFTNRYRILRRWLVELFDQGIGDGTIRADIDVEHEVTAIVAHLDGMRMQYFFVGHTALADDVRVYIDQVLERITT